MIDSASPDVVLVVDDEAYVLNTLCNMLTHSGYTVLRAASPEAALEIARTYPGPIDLLLSDVIMPRMSGPKMAEQVMQLHPEAACLFIAGLPDNPEIEKFVIGRGLAFLPKPFFTQALIAKVREVLDGRTIAPVPAIHRASTAV